MQAWKMSKFGALLFIDSRIGDRKIRIIFGILYSFYFKKGKILQVKISTIFLERIFAIYTGKNSAIYDGMIYRKTSTIYEGMIYAIYEWNISAFKIFVQFLNISSFYEEHACNLCQNNSAVYKERIPVIYDEEKKVAIY